MKGFIRSYQGDVKHFASGSLFILYPPNNNHYVNLTIIHRKMMNIHFTVQNNQECKFYWEFTGV